MALIIMAALLSGACSSGASPSRMGKLKQSFPGGRNQYWDEAVYQQFLNERRPAMSTPGSVRGRQCTAGSIFFDFCDEE